MDDPAGVVAAAVATAAGEEPGEAVMPATKTSLYLGSGLNLFSLSESYLIGVGLGYLLGVTFGVILVDLLEGIGAGFGVGVGIGVITTPPGEPGEGSIFPGLIFGVGFGFGFGGVGFTVGLGAGVFGLVGVTGATGVLEGVGFGVGGTETTGAGPPFFSRHKSIYSFLNYTSTCASSCVCCHVSAKVVSFSSNVIYVGYLIT